jgi:uncharacterized membrane-anchored protein YjiN (DUF445 family)
MAERLLADGVAEEVADRLFAGPELERIVKLALESEPLGEAIAGALENPGADRMLDRALESPGMERMVTRILESRVLDESVGRIVDQAAERLSRSDGLWVLVDEIAASPAVTEAIAEQSASFADHMAANARIRARTADDRFERVTWRLLRRQPRTPEESKDGSVAGPA